jgi:phosphatidylglycerol:prolipoprotein diacylglycerol transferase
MPFLPDVMLLGSFPLPTVALTGLLGGVLAYLLAGWQAKRDGAAPDGAQELILDLFIGGVLGAKLIYVVLDLGSYVANPASLIIFPYGPLALPGALVGAVALTAWGMRKEPKRLALFDQVAAPCVLGLAVATAGWVVPGSWSFAPLLGVAGLGALVVSLRDSLEAGRPRRRAAEV